MIFENMFYKVAEMFKWFRLLSKADENLSQLLPTVATEFLSPSDMTNILNNLNYDTNFDFTSHDSHMDLRGMGATVGVAGMPGSSSGAVATSKGSAGTSGVSAVVDPQTAAAGRHNSSGSTGSDGTHPGASPSSISNYSPTLAVGLMAAGCMPLSHQMALGLNPVLAAGFSAVSSVPVSNSVTQAASVASVASCDYPTFTKFDLHTEGLPNASRFVLPVLDSSCNVWYVLPSQGDSFASLAIDSPIIPRPRWPYHPPDHVAQITHQVAPQSAPQTMLPKSPTRWHPNRPQT